MSFTFDTRDVIRNLRQFERRFNEELETAVEKTTEFIVNAAKQGAPVKTGFLRNEIKEGVTRTVGKIIKGEVISDAPYSIWVELGTAFTAAHPYMRPALKRAEKVLYKEIQAAFRRAQA